MQFTNTTTFDIKTVKRRSSVFSKRTEYYFIFSKTNMYHNYQVAMISCQGEYFSIVFWQALEIVVQ